MFLKYRHNIINTSYKILLYIMFFNERYILYYVLFNYYYSPIENIYLEKLISENFIIFQINLKKIKYHLNFIRFKLRNN